MKRKVKDPYERTYEGAVLSHTEGYEDMPFSVSYGDDPIFDFEEDQEFADSSIDYDKFYEKLDDFITFRLAPDFEEFCVNLIDILKEGVTL